MITAQEAKDLAAPVRDKEIKDELEHVERHIIEVAKRGKNYKTFSLLLPEVINTLILQGFKAVTDYERQIVTISWN